MPTHRPGANISHCESMDVDDIDMSIPPPKPPRASALLSSMGANETGNSSSTPNIAFNHHQQFHQFYQLQQHQQMPWTSSTPKTMEPENKQLTALPTSTGVNYFTDGNETPKSIYSSGLRGKSQNSVPVTAEAQLRPKLHVAQKSWSCELREKALEMSKRGSGCMVENAIQHKEDAVISPIQLKPQTNVVDNSWSCKIKEKALEMSRRNQANAFEEDVQVQQPTKKALVFKTPEQQPNEKKVLINAVAYERIQQKSMNCNQSQEELPKQKNSVTLFSTPIARNTKGSLHVGENTSGLNSTFTFASPSDASHDSENNDDSSQSVKDRICYFNTLTTNSSKVFINLLKNSKTQNKATVQNSVSATNSPFATPLKPKRWATHLDLHLEDSTELSTVNLSQSHGNVTAPPLATTPSASATSPTSLSLSFSSSATPAAPAVTGYPQKSGTAHVAATPSYFTLGSSSSLSSGIQRKSSLRRKPSIEKSRRPIQRQNSNVSNGGGISIVGSSLSNGTKPQMHAVMEDLSLVMPVKLRIAEYERRIMMDC